jgi:hypothetical protein
MVLMSVRNDLFLCRLIGVDGHRSSTQDTAERSPPLRGSASFEPLAAFWTDKLELCYILVTLTFMGRILSSG